MPDTASAPPATAQDFTSPESQAAIHRLILDHYRQLDKRVEALEEAQPQGQSAIPGFFAGYLVALASIALLLAILHMLHKWTRKLTDQE